MGMLMRLGFAVKGERAEGARPDAVTKGDAQPVAAETPNPDVEAPAEPLAGEDGYTPDGSVEDDAAPGTVESGVTAEGETHPLAEKPKRTRKTQ